MPKKKVICYSTLGRFRSGKLMKIPLEVDENKLTQFLRQLGLEELIDLFCAAEYLNHKFKEQQYEGPDAKMVLKISLKLRPLSEVTPMRKRLDELELFVSPNYVQFGQRLCF